MVFKESRPELGAKNSVAEMAGGHVNIHLDFFDLAKGIGGKDNLVGVAICENDFVSYVLEIA